MAGLADQYLAHARPSLGYDIDRAALEHDLRRIVDAARASWPDLALDELVFVGHIAERSEGRPDPALRAADLYLACACAHGVPEALAAFDERYLARVPAFVARAADAREVADEVRLQLGRRLLVGEDGRPGRIADYQGRGSLENWVRAAAARTAMNLARGERRQHRALERAAAEARVQAPDPEIDYLKDRYGPKLEEAVRGAFAALSVRDRAVLRLHYVEHVAVGAIARSYGVHRGTVSRWLLGAQRQLHDETRRLLQERLDLSSSERESLVVALRSYIDVTFKSVL
jgi:RNA polymerase sigma-70 factor (ECF subfamily)